MRIKFSNAHTCQSNCKQNTKLSRLFCVTLWWIEIHSLWLNHAPREMWCNKNNVIKTKRKHSNNRRNETANSSTYSVHSVPVRMLMVHDFIKSIQSGVKSAPRTFVWIQTEHQQGKVNKWKTVSHYAFSLCTQSEWVSVEMIEIPAPSLHVIYVFTDWNISMTTRHWRYRNIALSSFISAFSTL